MNCQRSDQYSFIPVWAMKGWPQERRCLKVTSYASEPIWHLRPMKSKTSTGGLITPEARLKARFELKAMRLRVMETSKSGSRGFWLRARLSQGSTAGWNMDHVLSATDRFYIEPRTGP